MCSSDLAAFFSPFLEPAFFAPFAGAEVCSLILSFSRMARSAVALFRISRSSHKTLTQMNASRPLFPIVLKAGTALALLAGSLTLGGCVGNPFKDAKIDPASAVAGDVARITRQPGKFPTFASIPKKPTDIRPLAQYGQDARAVLAQGDAQIGRAHV